jgi:hypothetical protein
MVKVPTSLIIQIDYSLLLEEIKFSTSCGDLAARKNTHVQVYQIRIFRNCQSNACYCRKTIRKITIFESIPE